MKGEEARIADQSWLFHSQQVGLANASGQVGRNRMKTLLMSIRPRASAPNSGHFAPALGLTD